MARSWVRNRYHQASSRGVVVCRNRRVGLGRWDDGQPHRLSLPRDRLGRPVTLKNVADVRRAAAVAVARGRRRVAPQSKSARRASFWHTQSVRCTCPNLCLRPWKGLYARIGGQLDSRFGRCIFGPGRRGASCSVSRAHRAAGHVGWRDSANRPSCRIAAERSSGRRAPRGKRP